MKEKKLTKKTITWRIEKRKLADLKPHPENPRVFTDEGMKDLENSINSIGFMQPININQDGTILSGHARAMKLEEIGETEVDVYVPDRLLTPKQEEEVLVRLNANTAGEWDWDLLATNFDNKDVVVWGLNKGATLDNVDLSILEEKSNEEKNQDELKGILIEFELDHYEIALDLIKKYQNKINIGSFLLEILKNEQE
jgi:hypothetical protein